MYHMILITFVKLLFQGVKIFSFIGNKKMDVPANSQRDYCAEFYSYKEENYNFKVIFFIVKKSL